MVNYYFSLKIVLQNFTVFFPQLLRELQKMFHSLKFEWMKILNHMPTMMISTVFSCMNPKIISILLELYWRKILHIR